MTDSGLLPQGNGLLWSMRSTGGPALSDEEISAVEKRIRSEGS
ncbi:MULTISPECIES: hypothetical protein [Enterobacter cloacae complex]|uniref:Uncharacterized protein n=1 Tax=Enterobacter chuandaensis TaxID=2497875 RepID=A0AA96LYR2_9ENTR|nr:MULTISPECIES: hypothetical protein [Enterobacter cloacae complex]MDA4758774.1 hypothetical protein [Enterobacter chuandaensis]WNS36197.1 hypothetical protein RQP59_13945 [Enterobacter chuandaensis]